MIHDRFAARELPDKLMESLGLIPDLEKCPGIGNRRVDFQAIADNAGVRQEFLLLAVP